MRAVKDHDTEIIPAMLELLDDLRAHFQRAGLPDQAALIEPETQALREEAEAIQRG